MLLNDLRLRIPRSLALAVRVGKAENTLHATLSEHLKILSHELEELWSDIAVHILLWIISHVYESSVKRSLGLSDLGIHRRIRRRMIAVYKVESTLRIWEDVVSLDVCLMCETIILVSLTILIA